MIESALLAAGVASGIDMRRVALLAGVIHLPLVVAALMGVHWLRARPQGSHRSSLFCEGVASELRAGSSLRDALVAAARSAGEPIESSPTATLAEVTADVSKAFPSIGRELTSTVDAAARSGSDAAALFDEIGSLALAQDEVRHEVRVATAPGRVTALLLVGAPILYLSARFQDRGLADLLVTPEQRVIAIIGLGSFLLGAGGASAVLWRAGR